MKIIIKPLGALILFVAILLLAILAFRGQQRNSSVKEASSPIVVSNTSPGTASPVSAGTPASPLDSSASTAVRGQSIYRDGVENGWVSAGWNWAKDVDMADTTRPRSGTKAIRVRFASFDGVKFHHAPFNTVPYDRITFYVNGGDKGGQHISIGAACSEKNVADQVKMTPLPAKKWVSVTLPLTRINLANRPDMTSFWIQGDSSKPQESLYIDEVRLLKPGEPGPDGGKISLSK